MRFSRLSLSALVRANGTSWRKSPTSSKISKAGSSASLRPMGRTGKSLTQSQSTTMSSSAVLGSLERSVADQLQQFHAERDAESLHEYGAVVSAGIRLTVAGAVLLAVGVFVRKIITDLHLVWIPFTLTGVFCISCGIINSSVCPLDRLRVDELLHERVITRVIIGICLLLLSLFRATDAPHLHVLSAPPAFLLMLPRSDCRYKPAASTSILMWCGTTLIGICALHWSSDWPISARCAASATSFCGMVVMVVRWSFARFRMRCSHASIGEAATLALWEALYAFLGTHGMVQILSGTFTILFVGITAGEAGQQTLGMTLIAHGFLSTLPVSVVLVVGRDRLFRISARRFDRNANRARRDGAFIAELGDSMQILPGQVWYVHREPDAKDVAYKSDDRRHHWRYGHVVEVSAENFVVKVPKERQRRSKNLRERLETMDSVMTRVLSLAPSQKQQQQHQQEYDLVSLPMGARSLSSEALMELAHGSLRSIAWQHIDRELMASSAVCPHWRQITRHLGAGERIDLFMSHSWHDDEKTKFSALEGVAVKFQSLTRREPTFWLDKVCIDQDNISDCLRVLPVNVMACERVLVLCGHTYQYRLWCIWELFTLMAFTQMDHVMERLWLVTLVSDTNALSVAERLRGFDVAQARCYDPNEEARLRRVINALGKSRFCTRVRELGDACAAKRESHGTLTDKLNDGYETFTDALTVSLESISPNRLAKLIQNTASGTGIMPNRVVTGTSLCANVIVEEPEAPVPLPEVVGSHDGGRELHGLPAVESRTSTPDEIPLVAANLDENHATNNTAVVVDERYATRFAEVADECETHASKDWRFKGASRGSSKVRTQRKIVHSVVEIDASKLMIVNDGEVDDSETCWCSCTSNEHYASAVFRMPFSSEHQV